MCEPIINLLDKTRGGAKRSATAAPGQAEGDLPALQLSSQLAWELERLQEWLPAEVQRLEEQLRTSQRDNAWLHLQAASYSTCGCKDVEKPTRLSSASAVCTFQALQQPPATVDDGECDVLEAAERVVAKVLPKGKDLEEVWPELSQCSDNRPGDGCPSLKEAVVSPECASPRLRNCRESAFSSGSSLIAAADYLKLNAAWTTSEALSPELRGSGLDNRPFNRSLLFTRHMHMGSSSTEKHNDEACLMQRLISRPSARHRLVWDVVSILVLSYDVVFLPLEAFMILRSEVSRTLAMSTTIFWSVDFLRSFTVGYHDGGSVELRWKRVVMHYLTTWFTLDAIVLVIDWIYVVGVMSTALQRIGRLGKTTRLLRLLRTIRLVRLVKVTVHINILYDFIYSEVAVTIAKIVRFTMAVCLVNHFVACGWFAIGDAADARQVSTTWVEDLEEKHPHPSKAYMYLTALHWSLTQFTAASMEVMPMNTAERLYTVAVIVFALITLSSFVSTITQAMTHLRDTNQEKWQQQESLRAFLGQNRISMELSSRIFSFVRRYRCVAKSRVHEVDVHVFKAMPETLLVHLHYEAFMPVLLRHPFFSTLMQVDENALANLCHSATNERPLSLGQELFTYGTQATATYFTISGMMEYHRAGDEDGEVHLISEATSILCEMSLWLQWEHRGRMSASTPSELLCLDSELACCILRQTECLQSVQRYAQQFLEDIIAQHVCMGDLSDVWLDIESAADRAQQAFEEVLPHFQPTFSRGLARSSTTFFDVSAKRSTRADPDAERT
mmetsp:Transcript_55020/g.128696  ORF Transcript_55020/g.128696 Transcript_55020/m.128696 type:complete len:785 (+) Transcript_55020:62-2416(+)